MIFVVYLGDGIADPVALSTHLAVGVPQKFLRIF